ncbi:MAG: YncE family protein [Polyangia bacterium]
MRTILVLLLSWSLAPAARAGEPIPLPDGAGGIGFDDMLYSPALGKVLVPAGRTGRLALIDPRTRAVTTVDGFSKAAASGEGHGAGTTSADAGAGFLFASDRNLHVVDIIDPAARRIVGSVKLGGGPDYVRWVEPLGEVWVTEPNKKSIETFRFDRAATPPALTRLGAIEIADGPESLVIDAPRGRAYTHTWHDHSVAIDLKSHRVVATWANGCKGARGIALDGARGWLFVGCDEGKATCLDAAHDGKLLGSVTTAKGVDIIAWSPKSNHLYVPGGDDALLSIVAVGTGGALTVVGSAKTAADAHCVATDDAGHAYVCDPKGGRVLVVDDK